MASLSLVGGFTNPPVQSAEAFRVALDVMARPGKIAELQSATAPGLSPAAATLILTLCDGTTPVYLAGAFDRPDLRDWITFQTGAPFAVGSEAVFAVGTWDDLLPLDRFPVGTPEYPDRSTTLIVEVTALSETGTRLKGPGIKAEAALSLPGPELLAHNAALFPLGLDAFFTAGTRVAALPRTTQEVR